VIGCEANKSASGSSRMTKQQRVPRGICRVASSEARECRRVLQSEGLPRSAWSFPVIHLIKLTDTSSSFLKDIEGASAIRYQIYELLDMATWPL
jgi:hypothetical protein